MKSRSSWSKSERERQGYRRKLAWNKMKVTLSSSPPWETDNARERSDGEADSKSEGVERSDKDDDKSA